MGSDACFRRTNRTLVVCQHGFHARPRLRPWSVIWLAMLLVPLARSGLQRRGHRLFGKLVSFW